MFLDGILLALAESACTLILHLSARNSFPKPLPEEEEAVASEEEVESAEESEAPVEE